MPGFVVWFTGLSGAGKSTLASMLSAELHARGVHVEVLDGDEVRAHLTRGLGFSKEDRDTNVRRIGYVARLLSRSGAAVITAAISPYRAVRDEQRAQIGRFVEVHVSCSVSELARRDAKGLYRKALAGEIKGFTGIDDPYEEPLAPEITVRTDREPKEESLARILDELEELGLVAPAGAGAARGRGARRILPHGGELVRRRAEGIEARQLAKQAAALPVVQLDERSEIDVEMIASGALSPLRGFMDSKSYLRVVREMRLERGVPFPVPITLAVSTQEAESAPIGSTIALRSRDGRPVAILEVTDRFTPDKELEARSVYGTLDASHPGVAHLWSTGPVYLGGDIVVFGRPGELAFPAHDLYPWETRALFDARGWAHVVGFPARGPLHGGHEHVTKAALELSDGLWIQALVGAPGALDLPPGVWMRCHEALIEGYYPRDRVVLSTCPAAPRDAGPREEILRAIVARNHGCSRILVGGEHGAEARELFGAFGAGEIGIEPLFFEEPFRSTRTRSMATARTAPAEADAPRPEDALCAVLARGEVPPPELVRPEVAAILLDARRRGTSLLQEVTRIAKGAGEIILRHYEEASGVHRLKEDRSPLTAADLEANQYILEELARAAPAIPIVSEEAPLPDHDVRMRWERFWLVDPLDGTKEFLSRNGEFTVNIALVERGVPVLGVIYAPALRLLYRAQRGEGAWRQRGDAPPERIWSDRADVTRPLVVVESRSHGSPELDAFLSDLQVGERVSAGSSLKFCMVAEGRADIYPRLGPTMEWDVAAGDCIYRNSARSGAHTTSLRYNKPSLRNERFVIGL